MGAMQAVRFHAAHDIRVEQVDAPDEPGPHEVLIRPRRCGICGTDLHEYTDGPIVTPAEPHPLTGAELPQILGHELSADVEAVGREVKGVRAGDRVAVMPLVYCGACYYCRRGLNHLCQTMGCTGLSFAWGGLAEHAIVPDYQVAVLPDEVSYTQGALIEPAAVASYGVARGRVGPGDAVLVTGMGPIGGLVVLAATAAGAGAIYISEPNARRARRAEALGVTEVFDPTQVDLAGELRERTGGVGVDVAIECAGNAAALAGCLESVRRAGTVVQTGLHTKPATVDPMVWALNDLTIEGTWCFPVYDWPRIAAMVASGSFPIERVVTADVALEDTVPQGFDALLDPDGDELKVHIAPS